MSTLRVTKRTIEQYESLLASGQEKLYRHVLGSSIVNKNQCEYPELMVLDHSDAFFALHRRTGEKKHFVIGKILRKAAHKLYREFRRMNSEYPTNMRFLNVVK